MPVHRYTNTTRSWTACGPHDPARFLLAFLVRNRSIYSCRLSLSLPLSLVFFLCLCPSARSRVPIAYILSLASLRLLDNLSPLYLSTHVPFRWFPSLRPFALQTMSGIAISLRCHDEVCPGVCVCVRTVRLKPCRCPSFASSWCSERKGICARYLTAPASRDLVFLLFFACSQRRAGEEISNAAKRPHYFAFFLFSSSFKDEIPTSLERSPVSQRCRSLSRP